MHAAPVEGEDALGLVAVAADVAVKGPLAGVLPLVSDQRGPRLDPLVADAALELRLPVGQHVAAVPPGAADEAALAALRLLLLDAVLLAQVDPHLGLGERLAAGGARDGLPPPLRSQTTMERIGQSCWDHKKFDLRSRSSSGN